MLIECLLLKRLTLVCFEALSLNTRSDKLLFAVAAAAATAVNRWFFSLYHVHSSKHCHNQYTKKYFFVVVYFGSECIFISLGCWLISIHLICNTYIKFSNANQSDWISYFFARKFKSMKEENWTRYYSALNAPNE